MFGGAPKQLTLIKQKLYTITDCKLYSNLNDKINTKILLFETEITEYKDLLSSIGNSCEKLHEILEQIKDKDHLHDIKELIMDKIKGISNFYTFY